MEAECESQKDEENMSANWEDRWYTREGSPVDTEYTEG